MAKELSILDKKLPAHLQVIDTDAEEWGSGTASGFPVISTEGKIWRVKRGDEIETITKEVDGEDEPVTKLQLVILKAHKGVARTYYAKKYSQGDDAKPDCFSNDGVTPSPEAENRQCKTCAACPKAQWGSVITDNGKKGKACSEVKRLAVAPAGQINDPMLLRVPPTSLRPWDNYVASLIKRGVNPAQVVTQVAFDPEVTHQQLVFKAVDFIDEEQAAEVAAMRGNAVVEQIIGGTDPAPPESDAEDDDDIPAPPKPAAKRGSKKAAAEKPAPAPEPEDEAVEDADDDDDGLDLDDLDDIDFGD